MASLSWASALGLDPCLDTEFQGEHGGRDPISRQELCDWANTTGRRSTTGEWHCLGSPEPKTQNGLLLTILLVVGILLAVVKR